MNEKINAKLGEEISRNETRAEYGAWAVVLGLVIEVVLAIAFQSNKSFIENWAPVLADCLIVLGVYCEIHFGRRVRAAAEELQRLLDEKVSEATMRAVEAIQKAAEADERAYEAKSGLDKFKNPRSLSTEQQERITANLKLLATAVPKFDFAGIPIDFLIQLDQECIDLMGQIGSTLRAAGLHWEPWHGRGLPTPVYTHPGMPQAGIVAFTGLMVQIDDSKTPEWGAAVNVIWHTLKSEGLEIDRRRITDGTETPNAIHIYIGRKPQ